jgi:O-antigen ligase
VKNFSSIFLFLFVVLSILVSDGYQFLRYGSLFIFIIFSLNNLKRIYVDFFYWIFIYIILSLTFVSFLMGVFLFPDHVLHDARVPLFYFLIYSLFPLILKEHHINTFDKAIIFGSFLLSTYFFYMLLGKLGFSPLYLGDFLKQDYDQEIIDGRMKIYANHLSILTFLFPYLFFRVILGKSNKIILFTVFVLAFFAAILSLRRGVILSGFIGIILGLIILYSFQKLKVSISWLIAFACLLLLLIYNLSDVDFNKSIDELKSSVNFESNASNLVRKEQLEFFINKIKDRPIIGYGIGAHDIRYVRDPTNPTHFELGYVSMIYKGGLLLFFTVSLFCAYFFLSSLRIIKLYPVYFNRVVPILAGWLSLLIYHASNPIFSQFSYLLFFFLFFYMIYVIKSVKKIKL